MSRLGRALVLAAFSCLTPPLASARDGQSNETPATVPQTGRQAEAIGRNLSSIEMPPGFEIELYALVPDARQIAVAPRGEVVFVGTTGAEVYAVTTSEPSRTVTEFAGATRKNMPNGVCFGKDGTLFVVEFDRVLAFQNAESAYADPALPPRTIVAQGALMPSEEKKTVHGLRVCKVGPDGKLYIALGDPDNVPPPERMPLYRSWGIGGIVRMDPDGSKREVFARGIRNSVGMDFNPADDVLWFTDNQVDWMGDDIPPGELNRAPRIGLDFGFPWYGGGRIRTKEYRYETAPVNVAFPEVEMVAHAADLGMVFYRGTMFPERFRGGIFSAQHGSWNRRTPVGARVMFTAIDADGRADKAEPFAEGWLKDRKYRGRPVDVAELPDGSLLVSDDHAGALYRITYRSR